MDASFVGRRFPLPGSYAVGVEKIREFADAVGETAPIHHDRAAARAAGFADVVAPPTFSFAVINRAQEVVLFDPELGLDYSRVVHGDQSFSYHRPIVAGDELTCVMEIEQIRNVAGNDMITLRADITGADGEPVVTGRAMLVSRAAETSERPEDHGSREPAASTTGSSG